MAAKFPHVNAANRYARDVVGGKIPACTYVRQACQRHLDDLAATSDPAFPFRFDKAAAEKICEFAELMPHVKGKWAGTLIALEPWQKFCLAVPFGWKRKSDGLRRFREIYEEIPRKNGKSIIGAVIGNYMLAADGEMGAEVYSGAGSEKQALEVFRPAWQMVKNTPEFQLHFGLQLSGTHKNPTCVYSVETASRFEPVVGNPGDGASPHCAIVDEYHEHKSSALYDTMKTGMGAREQPMQVVITTAGTDTAVPCYEKRIQVIKILSGEIQNDQIFGIIYTLDPEDDWTDFENWKKANPNFGVSVFSEYLKAQHLDALQSAAKQNILCCKHLNRWANAGSAWMNMVKWEQCADHQLRLSDFDGEDCWIGVDLASKIDVTCFVLVFRRGEHYYLFPRFYLPEEESYGDDRTHYAGWAHQEFITLTPGNRIDQDLIEADLMEMAGRFNVISIAHDPWNAAAFVTNMMKFFRQRKTGGRDNRQEAQGILVEVPQTTGHLSDPMKEMEALIYDGKLHHDGNPVMTWMMSNVVVQLDRNDNIFPRKERPANKIDGPVAAIMAIKEAMLAITRKSIYEERGVLTL